MNYKFEIGDKVKMIAYTNFMPKCACEPFLKKTLIITARGKGVLGNQYEVTNPKNDESIAWVNEIQLEKEKKNEKK